jgi:DNA-binding transcriptional LysR family regulator
MDTDKCAALLCAIRVGNLSDAAQKLGYTPSGMSRMMASLEAETGFPLLHRSRSGVTPTKECQKLLPIISELARLSDMYTEEAQTIMGLDVGEVHIGTAYSTYYELLGKMIAKFTAKHPHIKIEIQEGFSSVLVDQIEKHRIDFCIISWRKGNFDWYPLPEDHMVAWVPKDFPVHTLDDPKVFPMKRFETESCIDIFPDQVTDNSLVFSDYNITPNYSMSAMNTYSASAMVEAGLGVTMCNDLYTETAYSENLKVLRLDPDPVISIGIATAPKEELSPAANKFRIFAFRYLSDHPEEIHKRR